MKSKELEMKNKFLLFVSGTGTLLLCCLSGMSQDRASMSSPVVRSTGEEVVISARFQNFVPGNNYRIGVGVARDQLPDLKVELLGDDATASLDNPSIDFVQGHTQNWWKVSQLVSRGYQISRTEASEPAGALTLRFTMTRDEADELDKLFVFICRNYGGETWYLEDGTEIDQSSW